MIEVVKFLGGALFLSFLCAGVSPDSLVICFVAGGLVFVFGHVLVQLLSSFMTIIVNLLVGCFFLCGGFFVLMLVFKAIS